MSQWGEGVLRRSVGGAPSRRKQDGLGAEPLALGDFCNFSIKITHFYAYFGQVILKQ